MHNTFIQQYEKEVIGHLNGFGRLVLRGTLRALSVKSGMLSYLWNAGIRMKDVGKCFHEKSQQLKAVSWEQAKRQGRPVIYLASPKTDKEEVARQIVLKDGIKEGLKGRQIATAIIHTQHIPIIRVSELAA
jgi:hypothetical protein